jgi:Uma2 family endonuclease
VKTVVLGPRPPELEELIQRRRTLGIDLFDEVWEGSYHMVPAPHPGHGYIGRQLAVPLAPLARAAGLVGTDAFNLGESDNYRVPDAGYHRELPSTTWVPTAAVVVEVLSPDDETYDKFPFYAARGVDELIVADPAARPVTCWILYDEAYRQSDRSVLLAVAAADLQARLDWP